VRPAEKKIQKAQKPHRVQRQQAHLDDGMRGPLAQQESGAIDFQHKCFEQRQREKTEMLIFHGEPSEPALPCRLILGKCE